MGKWLTEWGYGSATERLLSFVLQCRIFLPASSFFPVQSKFLSWMCDPQWGSGVAEMGPVKKEERRKEGREEDASHSPFLPPLCWVWAWIRWMVPGPPSISWPLPTPCRHSALSLKDSCFPWSLIAASQAGSFSSVLWCGEDSRQHLCADHEDRGRQGCQVEPLYTFLHCTRGRAMPLLWDQNREKVLRMHPMWKNSSFALAVSRQGDGRKSLFHRLKAIISESDLRAALSSPLSGFLSF
jgi:hypothetical protein